MNDDSRWARWGSMPYRVLAVVLIVVGFGARFLPGLSFTTRNVVTIVGFPLLVIGVVLLLGPQWHRARQGVDAEVRRNPTGKTTPLDERLRTVERPRSRWVFSAVLAVAFGIATAWATYMAANTGRSAFVGLAILFFVPLPFLCWLAWRTRSLLRRGPEGDV